MLTCNTSLSYRHTYAVNLADKAGNPTHLICHSHSPQTISDDPSDACITHSIPDAYISTRF